MAETFRHILFCIIFFIGSLVTHNALAANYHVRVDGNDTRCTGLTDAADTGSGSNQPCAWRTIQKGAVTGTCGDTVLVGNGTYTERVTVADTCASGSVFTLRAQNMNLAVLNGSIAGFVLSGNYITTDGFKVQDYTSVSWYGAVSVSGNHNTVTNMYMDRNRHLFSIYISGTHTTVSHNYIYQPQFGISVGGSDNLILNNEVDQLIQWEVNDTDYLRYFGDNHTIRGNYFHGADITTLGAQGSHVDCFQTFTDAGAAYSNNIIIENNRCEDTHEGIMASNTPASTHASNANCTALHTPVYCCSGNGTGNCPGISRGLTIRNNVFKNCTAFAMAIANIKDVSIYNNTITDWSQYGIACGYDDATADSNCSVKNNIFYNGPAAYSGNNPYFLLGAHASWTDTPVNNLMYSINKSYSAAAFSAPNIVNQDPLFVSSSDYHLQYGSPARDAGTTIASVAADYAGVVRPQGAEYDIGSYEYVSGGNDTTPPAAPAELTVD